MPTLIYLLCLAGVSTALADESSYQVEHIDVLRPNTALTLKEVIDAAAERYPTMALLKAKAEEAAAYRDFAETPFAGSHVATIAYGDDRPVDNTGQREFAAEVQVQIWQWGELSAVEKIAEAADSDQSIYRKFLRYTVAELIRDAVWRVALTRFQYENAKKLHGLARELFESVNIRVDSGDLAAADLLLAESEFLDSKTELILAEAEVMHARRAYISITGLHEIPDHLEETQSPVDTVDMNHVAIQSINAGIEKEKAKITYLRFQTNSQLLLGVGYTRQHAAFGSPVQNSLDVNITVPFGAPQRRNALAASANVALNELVAERDSLKRNLELRLHEAEHDIQVGKANLKLATDRAHLQEKYIASQDFAFKNGEIGLSELLIARKRAYQAIRNLEQQQIMLKRDIALYNQVVGVLP
ncbi:MAG: TolC family protein [Gammaproteobacteria bacterium]